MLAPWKKIYDKTRQHIKKQRHYFADQIYLLKAMVFLMVIYGMRFDCKKKAEY